MKFKSVQWLMALLLTTLAAANTWAADVNCSLQNVGSFDAYFVQTATSVKRVVPVIFEVWCDRGGSGGQTSTALNYSVAINNGANVTTQTPATIMNKAFVSGTTANPLLYDFYTDNSCTTGTQWSGLNVATTIVRPSVSTMFSRVTLYGCVDQIQSVPDNTYRDNVKLTLTGSAGTTGNSVTFSPASPASLSYSIPVNLTTPPTCTLSTPLGNVAFGTYTAFGGALAKTVNMNATCSVLLPYTMSIPAANTYGVLAGLNYSLSFSDTSVTNTVNVIGTGTPLGTPLYAKMAAGQAGTCGGTTSASCNATATSAPITLTITY